MKIACVLGPMFEDSEFKLPYDAFKQAGHEVTVIGLEAGAQLPGQQGHGDGDRRENLRPGIPGAVRCAAHPRGVISRQAARS